MDAQADFLLVVTWSKGEGHLVVSGVHHVFVPLCETAGDGLQHCMKLKKNKRERVESHVTTGCVEMGTDNLHTKTTTFPKCHHSRSKPELKHSRSMATHPPSRSMPKHHHSRSMLNHHRIEVNASQ